MSQNSKSTSVHDTSDKYSSRGTSADKRSGKKKVPMRHILIDIPIGTRLTLGFLAAALIAAFVAGATGFQQTQSLNSQSSFYQTLLKANTSLTTGEQYLQLMNQQTTAILGELNAPTPSQETLTNDKQSLHNLINLYSGTINDYLNNYVITKHTDQVQILTLAGQQEQIGQQKTLIDSTLRTWHVYQNAVNQITTNIDKQQLQDATNLEKAQGEPTNSDAISALRTLVQFNGLLARSVQDAANVQNKNQIITTIIWSIIAFIGIILIGWIISGTLIQRLSLLREVTQAVEQGQFTSRVQVIGHDEIADVSKSVNSMLESITSLLEETRSQRDALTNAAERLFSDMRIVNARDLRISAPVSSDPIGMLANAFNFTIGRFRRFLQRTKSTVEQLDVIARQTNERSEAFIQALSKPRTNILNSNNEIHEPIGSAKKKQQSSMRNDEVLERTLLHIHQKVDQIQEQASGHFSNHSQIISQMTEQITTATERITKFQIPSSAAAIRWEEMRSRYVQEIYLMRNLLIGSLLENQGVQKQATTIFQELDKDLTQVILAIYTHRNQTIVEDEKGFQNPPLETFHEITKIGMTYANEINIMARQLATLANEIRYDITTFQLDPTDHDTPARPITTPLNPHTTVHLSSGLQKHVPLAEKMVD